MNILDNFDDILQEVIFGAVCTAKQDPGTKTDDQQSFFEGISSEKRDESKLFRYYCPTSSLWRTPESRQAKD